MIREAVPVVVPVSTSEGVIPGRLPTGAVLTAGPARSAGGEDSPLHGGDRQNP